jgi:hypothetical protein
MPKTTMIAQTAKSAPNTHACEGSDAGSAVTCTKETKVLPAQPWISVAHIVSPTIDVSGSGKAAQEREGNERV